MHPYPQVRLFKTGFFLMHVKTTPFELKFILIINFVWEIDR